MRQPSKKNFSTREKSLNKSNADIERIVGSLQRKAADRYARCCKLQRHVKE